MKFKSSILNILLLFALGVPDLSAQNYIFDYLNVEEGLSQSSVNSIVQDRTGYIWFGTSNGLNRYDGYQFKVYRSDKEDSLSLSNNAVTALFVDSAGELWVGTTDGILNKFNPESDTFTKYEFINDSLSIYLLNKYYDYPLPISRFNETTITSIAEDKDGYLWIGTWGRGLVRFDKTTGNFQTFTHDPLNPLSINFNRITKVLVDRLGVIWVATFGGGLNKIIKSLPANPSDTEEIAFFNFSNDLHDAASLGDNKILTLYEDSNRDLWIGMYDGGLDRLDFERRYLTGKSPKFEHFRKKDNGKGSLTSNTIMAITQNSEGYLWIGTLGGGLCRFNYKTGKIITRSEDTELSKLDEEDDVLSIYEDRSGNLWVGANLGKGVTVIKRKPFKFKKILLAANSHKGAKEDIIWAIHKDRSNDLWVGTYRGGIFLLKADGTKRYFTPENSALNDYHIRCFEEDERGNMWIGAYSGGLNFYNKRTGKYLSFLHNAKDSNSLPSNQVQDLLVSGDTLWIGTFGGGLCYADLARFYSSGKMEFMKALDSNGSRVKISDDRVYTLLKDDEGNLLVGTFGGGLNVVDGENASVKLIESNGSGFSSLNDNRVISLFNLGKGEYLIGTYGGGLNYYDANADTIFSIRPGNKNLANAVYGMLSDDSGMIWLSSDNGLFKFNPNNYSFVQYDINDGLQSMEFSGGAYFKDKEGVLYFGGINGLNYFSPDSIIDNAYIPPVVITSIKIFNEELKGEKKELIISVSQNFFSFEFAALDYTSPMENKYAYILEGFENQWHFTNARYRVANYTNLEPGRYVFKVKGSNNDGLWNETAAELYLTIVPHFYTTWWFILIAAVLIIGSALYLVTLKVRHMIVIEKLKSGLAADLHDNIGAGLTEISILSELAANDAIKYSETSHANIKKISERARQLVDSMSDIVWFINPSRDSLYDLAIRLKDSYGDTLYQMGIQFKTINLDKLKNVKLPMDYKQNLFLIFKESLNNAIKHGRCGKIIFETDMKNGYLILSLSDDGIGFDLNEETAGNGIHNIKKRAEEIGGKLVIITNRNSGTKIEFTGKIKKANKFNLND